MSVRLTVATEPMSPEDLESIERLLAELIARRVLAERDREAAAAEKTSEEPEEMAPTAVEP